MMYNNNLFLFLLSMIVSSGVCFLEIQVSGVDDTPIFSTVIRFYLGIISSQTNSTVSIQPEQCCLNIGSNDTDCKIMDLGNSKNVTLTANEMKKVTFAFRNLYARYRRGHCSFIIQEDDEYIVHTIPFNTYPNNNTDINCTIDQDSDRQCKPVDCAIKYKGHRNYYNLSIGKCQPVAKCHTRGEDGITVTAYYDWNTNECIEYKWFNNNNYLNNIESDTDIPVSIDPSQTKYYPDLEPHLMTNSTVILSCNRGVQHGLHCVCDKGWISSGIHRDTPSVFHWCDKSQMMALSTDAPRKLNGTLEYVCIILLSIVNVILASIWMYLSVKLCCNDIIRKIKGSNPSS